MHILQLHSISRKRAEKGTTASSRISAMEYY